MGCSPQAQSASGTWPGRAETKLNLPCEAALSFHEESDSDGHLPVLHRSFVDVTALCDRLEPAQFLSVLCARLMALSKASSMEIVEVPVSSVSL
jgi:hypothetical protein